MIVTSRTNPILSYIRSQGLTPEQGLYQFNTGYIGWRDGSTGTEQLHASRVLTRLVNIRGL